MRREPAMDDVFKLALQTTGQIEKTIQIRLKPRERQRRAFWCFMFSIMPFVLYWETKIAYNFLKYIFEG